MVTIPVLCVVTCRDKNNITGHLEMAYAAIMGGANMIQVRDKTAATSTLIALAAEIKRLIDKKPIKLIINDNTEAALCAECDGVHLGAEDMGIQEARAALGRKKIIGASAGNISEATVALQAGADYLGVGPVFETDSKPDAGDPIGLQGLKEIVKVASVPVIGIGGITTDKAKRVMDTGAGGVAVISEIANADNKRQAVTNLVEALNIPLTINCELGSRAKSGKN